MSQAELTMALVKAQSQFPPIVKNSKNPHLRNTYADLGEIIAKTQPVLADNGLCIVQPIANHNGSLSVQTRLLHISGAEIVSDLPLTDIEPGKGTTLMQAMGSAITYARRYGYISILSITAEEDDDGNTAHGAKRQPQQEWAPPPVARPSNAAPQPAAWLFKDEHTVRSFPNATGLIKHMATVRWTADLALNNRAVAIKALDTAAAGLKAKPDNATVKGLHRQAQEVAQKVLDLLEESDTVDDGGMIDQPLQAA